MNLPVAIDPSLDLPAPSGTEQVYAVTPAELSEKHQLNGDAASPSIQAEGDGQDSDKYKNEYITEFRLLMIMDTVKSSTLIAALDLVRSLFKNASYLQDIGWYSGGVFLTVAATPALWGKMFTNFPVPVVYMTALGLYLVGIVLNAAAPNDIGFIIGRAIQGWGCSGTLGGSSVIINHAAAPGDALCSSACGVFTTEVTWRWCFWVNLPIGGAATILQFTFLRLTVDIAQFSDLQLSVHALLTSLLPVYSRHICHHERSLPSSNWGFLRRRVDVLVDRQWWRYREKTRLLQPVELAGALFATLGAGLLYGLSPNSPKAWYIGAQIPLGFGVGLANQVPITTLQSFAKPEDLASTMGIVFMAQPVAGTYFVFAAQSVFSNRIIQSILQKRPSVDMGQVLFNGASEIPTVYSGADLDTIFDAYMGGIKDVYTFSLAAAAFAVLWCFVIPSKKLANYDQQKTEATHKAGGKLPEDPSPKEVTI
ncbi:putative Dehydrocurvularin exporter [Seiridium cardinale]|uniref:Dehydrocurvularin exporter n=1 Tax=Seiridium cardinale TaxID=138064 RepID=A0ABR2XWX0_9PEZI